MLVHQSIQARSGYSAAAALGTRWLLDGQFESLPVQIEDLSFVRKIWYWHLQARFPWLDPPLLGGPLSLWFVMVAAAIPAALAWEIRYRG